MKRRYRAAVLLVNWNNGTDTIHALDSLRGMTVVPHLFVIIDNNSSDNSIAQIREYFQKEKISSHYIDGNEASTGTIKEQVKVILYAGKENLGFTGGNNFAIEIAIKAGCDLFWMLNTDTFVEPDALDCLMSEILADTTIGIVGSHMYYASGKNRFQTAGTHKIIRWKGYGDTGSRVPKSLCDSYDTASVSGCSMMITLDLINDVGVLDDNIFAYVDETEYCIRATKRKWRVVSVPKSIVYHKISRSVPRHSKIRNYYETRNVLYLLKKHFPIWLPLGLFYHLVRITFYDVVVKKKKIDLIIANLKGYLDFMFNGMGKCERRL